MTTINDRLEKLEDAFVELVPLVRQISATQQQMNKRLDAMDGRLTSLEKTQNQMLETQNQMLETQKQIISTLQAQSTDIALIKEYLG